jgi:hypothetical protein
LYREDNRGVGHVDDDVDAVNIDPAPRYRSTNIGLVLVIGVDDLDRLACRLAAKILDRPMRVASIEPSPESDEKTPDSSVSTPNFTTPPEISPCASDGPEGATIDAIPRRAAASHARMRCVILLLRLWRYL